jgi:Tol biopolymer transport system component
MLRLSVVLSLVLAALVVPATASATLVFDRGVLKQSVWIAGDDGAGAHKLVDDGSMPRVSDDGATVVFYRTGNRQTFRPDLMAVPADGSAPARTLVKGWRDTYTFAWTADGKTIATVVGPELGAKRLVLIDVTTGAARTVARGYFAGATFSADGAQLLYARSASERFPYRSDLYRVDVAGVGAGAAPVAVTHDHRSQYPLWSPAGQVVFVKLVDAKRRKYGPKNELYVMAGDGTGVRRLTRTKVDQLLQGLTPTAWSGDGTRLLAEFGGQDTSYAETVNPLTGAHKPVVKAEESGFVGTDLSKDGSTILGATGGFDPGSRHDIVTIPYAGGSPTVLVRKAFNPDWNR